MTSSGSERRIVVAGRAVATQRSPPLFPAAPRPRAGCGGSRRVDLAPGPTPAAGTIPECRSIPSHASLDLVALEEPRARRAGTPTTCSPRACAGAAGAPEWVFYEGPPTANGRPGHPPRVGPPLQGPLPALPHHAGQARRPQGRLGLPRPAGRGRGREGARLLGKHEIEDYGIERVQPRSAASRCSATSRTGQSLTEPHRHVARHRRRVLDARPTTTSRASGGCSARCGTRARIYEGHKVVPYCGRCGTALSSHELGQPGAYRDVTEPSVYVRFPRRRPRLRPPRVDDHAVDAAVERRRRGRPRHRLRARARARGRARPRHGARPRRRRARRRRRGRRRRSRSPTSSALRYERPFDARSPVEGDARARVVAADFVTIDDGSGIVHLAPAFGEIDREVGEREGLPILNPVNDAARFDADGRRAVRGPVREGRRPRAHRRPRARAGQLVRGRRLHALLPALLALRHAAHLLGQAHVVRAHVGAQGRAARARTRRSAGTPSTSSTAASATGSRTTSTGRSRATATGARRSRCGAATTAATTRASARSPSCRSSSGRDLAGLDLHRPVRRRRHDRVPGVRRPAPRTASQPVLDAWFDSGSMPAAQFHYPFENADAFDDALPRRLHLRGDRPDPRLVLLAARGQHAGVRPHAVPQRRLPRAHRRPGRPEDVEVAGQRHRPVAGARRRAAPTRCAGTFLVGLAVDAASASRSKASTRRPASSCHAVEHLLVLRHLREPRRLDARPARRPAAPTHVLDRWIALAPARHGRARSTDALEGFDALRGAQALDALRRRPLELVRAPVRARASGSRPTPPRTRRCTSASRPSRSCSRRSARSSPTSCTATSRRTDESVHLADWPAVDDAAIDDALEAEMERARAVVSLGLVGAQRRQAQGAPAAAPRARAAARRRRVLATTVAREIADELNVKQLEAVTTSRVCSTYAVVPELPRARAAARQAGAAGQGRCWPRSTARAVQARARRATAATTSRRRRHDRAARPGRRRGPRRVARGARARAGRRATRSRSTRPSTTTCAPRASRASSSGCSTTSARPGPRDRRPRPRAPGRDRSGRSRRPPHRDWIAGEVLAVELVVEPGSPTV